MSKIFVLLTFIISYSYSIFSQNLADTASIYIKEYKKICNGIDKEVWNISLDVPIMFLDSTKDIAYLSHSVNKELKKYKNIFIYPLKEKHEISAPIMDWKGLKWVVVHIPFSGSTRELMGHIAHEAFHTIQEQLSIPESIPSYTHLNTLEGRFLMHMEILELHKALGSPNKAQEYISNAISIRKFRYSLFPDADSIETRAELNEGLAEYTGWTYAQISEKKISETV